MNPDKPPARGHVLESIELSATAAADDLVLPLVPGIVFLTGGCGSYKTAIANLARYAVGAPPPTNPVRCADYLARVEAALGSGTVTVRVATAQGARYTSSRKFGAVAIVRGEDGAERPGVTLDGELFTSQFFAPHEVEGIALSPKGQLALLDRFDEAELRRVEAEIVQLERKFLEGAGELRTLAAALAEDAERTAELPQLEEARRGMQRAEGADAAALARAHEEKALRGRERLGIGELEKDLAHVRLALGELAKGGGARIARAVDASLENGAHGELFRRAHGAAQRAAAAIEAVARHAHEALIRAEREIHDEAQSLASSHAHEDEAYTALVARNDADREQAAARDRLQRRHDELSLLKKREITRREEYERTYRASRALLDERRALLGCHWELRRGIQARINDRLAGCDVRVDIKQAANTDAYLALIQDVLRGSGTLGGVIEAIGRNVLPADLVAAAREDRPAPIMKVDPRPTNKEERARKILRCLRESNRLEEIEIAPLADVPTISLKVSGALRPTGELSSGQACICVLVILLLLAKGPIVLDEPEASLDDNYLTTVLVPALREVKKVGQLLIVSHHPTLIVLTEPERVVRAAGDLGRARIERQGTLEEMRDVIERMDGGKDAFLLRAKLYGHKVDG